MNPTRRSFIKKSMAVAGMASTFALSGLQASGQVLGANDRLRLGVVGIRGRGKAHIKEFSALGNVEIACLVDVDETLLAPMAETIEKNHGNKPMVFQDIRKALDEKNLDAISIATCNHTHSLYTIWGVQAEKDVYVEKPCSHNVFEGRKCVEAAEKYQRIVQHGTQSRCSNGRALLLAALQSGQYGTLKIAKAYCCKPRWSIGYRPEEIPPNSFAWDQWLGPAPMQPFHRNLAYYNWHWFWDTGNGDIGNQGVHEMDLCRWMTGRTLPQSVVTFGARYVDEPDRGFKDQGQTPNQALTLFDYGNVKILFETRGLVKPKTAWENITDIELYTDQGVLRGSTFTPHGQKETVKLKADFVKRSGSPFKNFVDCVKNRNRGALEADILEGHYSASLCHLSNISYRLGETASLDTIRETFGEDAVVQEALANVVNNTQDALPQLKDPQYTLGPSLSFDAEQEKFVDNKAADALLSREYRTPYVVPETV